MSFFSLSGDVGFNSSSCMPACRKEMSLMVLLKERIREFDLQKGNVRVSDRKEP